MVSFNLTIVLFGAKTEAKYRDEAPLGDHLIIVSYTNMADEMADKNAA